MLEALARPDDVWRDIGAGGGRLAIPLAGLVRRVVAVDPSPSMRETLSAAAAEASLDNLDIVAERWPLDGEPDAVDVSLTAHAIYDIGGIAPYLDAMERTTRRLCIVILADRARGGHLSEVWEAMHDEPFAELPALPEFLALLGARGRAFEVRSIASGRAEPVAEDDAFALGRRLCWLGEGSAGDARMRAFIRERYGAGEGRVQLPAMRRHTGIVTWEPPAV